MASCQLDHFKTKIRKLMDSLPINRGDPCRYLVRALDKWNGRNSRPAFTLREVTLNETLQYLWKLGNSSSFGFDTIDSIALKAVASDIVAPLQKVINLSINQRKFANKWKIAAVIPLYKGKGLVRTSPNSYGPISLLPVTAKIAERAVQHQLLKYMETTL